MKRCAYCATPVVNRGRPGYPSWESGTDISTRSFCRNAPAPKFQHNAEP